MNSNINHKVPVLVAGALGRMGSEVIKAVYNSETCELIGAVDSAPTNQGEDIGLQLGLPELGIAITNDLEGTLCSASQLRRNENHPLSPVLVDFTHPSCVYEHARASIAYGVHPVIGTTGLSSSQICDLEEFANKADIGAAVIPNFSLGMVLLQQAAAAAARFYEYAELTELHHNLKVDAPSGTCIKTAEMIESLGKSFNKADFKEEESVNGCRGGLRNSGLRMHSIRLPGLVAHQEVIFGAPGETLTLRHDTIERSAYMPGVLLVIKKVRQLKGLVYGLEKII